MAELVMFGLSVAISVSPVICARPGTTNATRNRVNTRSRHHTGYLAFPTCRRVLQTGNNQAPSICALLSPVE
jgi:hypothetical protein